MIDVKGTGVVRFILKMPSDITSKVNQVFLNKWISQYTYDPVGKPDDQWCAYDGKD